MDYKIKYEIRALQLGGAEENQDDDEAVVQPPNIDELQFVGLNADTLEKYLVKTDTAVETYINGKLKKLQEVLQTIKDKEAEIEKTVGSDDLKNLDDSAKKYVAELYFRIRSLKTEVNEIVNYLLTDDSIMNIEKNRIIKKYINLQEVDRVLELPDDADAEAIAVIDNAVPAIDNAVPAAVPAAIADIDENDALVERVIALHNKLIKYLPMVFVKYNIVRRVIVRIKQLDDSWTNIIEIIKKKINQICNGKNVGNDNKVYHFDEEGEGEGFNKDFLIESAPKFKEFSENFGLQDIDEGKYQDLMKIFNSDIKEEIDAEQVGEIKAALQQNISVVDRYIAIKKLLEGNNIKDGKFKDYFGKSGDAVNALNEVAAAERAREAQAARERGAEEKAEEKAQAGLGGYGNEGGDGNEGGESKKAASVDAEGVLDPGLEQVDGEKRKVVRIIEAEQLKKDHPLDINVTYKVTIDVQNAPYNKAFYFIKVDGEKWYESQSNYPQDVLVDEVKNNNLVEMTDHDKVGPTADDYVENKEHNLTEKIEDKKLVIKNKDDRLVCDFGDIEQDAIKIHLGTDVGTANDGEGKNVEADSGESLTIDIWGANEDETVGQSSHAWAKAKATVVEKYAQTGNSVFFFDDTQDNVNAVKKLVIDDISAILVYRRIIEEDDKNKGKDMFNFLNEKQHNLENTVVIFDFDMTLTDTHSRGTTLKIAKGDEDEDGGTKYIFCDGALCFNRNWENQPDFVDDSEYYETNDISQEIKQNLVKLQQKCKKLVICSRGKIEDLNKVFEEYWGFTVQQYPIILTEGNELVVPELNDGGEGKQLIGGAEPAVNRTVRLLSMIEREGIKTPEVRQAYQKLHNKFKSQFKPIIFYTVPVLE